jgi:hypothetical protein
MNLNKLYHFIKVLHSKRKHYTKNDYFSSHIQFMTFFYVENKYKLFCTSY